MGPEGTAWEKVWAENSRMWGKKLLGAPSQVQGCEGNSGVEKGMAGVEASEVGKGPPLFYFILRILGSH